jgi:hypothetical protein
MSDFVTFLPTSTDFTLEYRLMDYVGPEGDEARALLREIRALISHGASNEINNTNASQSLVNTALQSPIRSYNTRMRMDVGIVSNESPHGA